jgi:predicted DCC family thiol-disulfide oxidoreductase YuxK
LKFILSKRSSVSYICPKKLIKDTRTILFYDGDCGLCSRAVRFVVKYERIPNVYFCSIQSEFARDFLKQFNINSLDLNTLYLFENNRIYQKSTGALKILPYLKKRFSILCFCWIFPRFIRDAVYDLIAKNRKRFFKDKCDLMAIDKSRFLDED